VQRVRSGRLNTLPEKGVKVRRIQKPYHAGPGAKMGPPAYERIEALAPIIEDMVAAGFTQAQIAKHIINPTTGEPISTQTLSKYYKKELELGMDLANLKVSRSAFNQAVGYPGMPNPDYLKRNAEGVLDKRKWLVEPVAPTPVMTIWWEKTRAGKKEGMVHEHIGGPVNQFVVVLPSNGRDYNSQPVLDLIERTDRAITGPTHGRD